MTRIRLIILGVLSMVFVSMCAQTESWSLQQCIGLALDNSLYIKNEQIAVGKAKDLQGTTFDIEKTTISLSQDPTSGGSPDNGITISQTFDFPTVYNARSKFLKAETAVAQSQVAIVANQLARDVTSAYYSWLHAHDVLLVLQKQDSVYQHFLQLAAAKHKSGEANQLERMNAQRLLNENRISLQRTENDCKKYLLQLKQLINTDADFTPKNEGFAKLYDATLGETKFSDTPLGRNYQARLISNERKVSLAKQGYMPSFTLGFTTQAVIKGFNPYNIDRSRFSKGNFMGFEIGIGIPMFWKSNQAKVKAAKRDMDLVQNERAMAEQQQETLIRDATNEYMRAKQVLDYYEKQGNADATLMSKLSQTNYENGEMGYVEYIQNLTSALDVQLRYIDAVNDYNQAIININYLNGNKQ